MTDFHAPRVSNTINSHMYFYHSNARYVTPVMISFYQSQPLASKNKHHVLGKLRTFLTPTLVLSSQGNSLGFKSRSKNLDRNVGFTDRYDTRTTKPMQKIGSRAPLFSVKSYWFLFSARQDLTLSGYEIMNTTIRIPIRAMHVTSTYDTTTAKVMRKIILNAAPYSLSEMISSCSPHDRIPRALSIK